MPAKASIIGGVVIETGTQADALRALSDGEVVAIPTDTVYGLAARLDRPRAIESIFAIKMRPHDQSLPVLIGRIKQLDSVVAEWPRAARQLANRFWPGAITLVVPARPDVGELVGGSGETVGVRLPRNRIARSLIKKAGPLVVTSANLHGQPESTTSLDVVRSFVGGQDDRSSPVLVLDGGTCDSAPSTVVDCTVSPPACIREGGVPSSWVEAALR